MPIRCVLFDFDGVIADTEERNADYLASALAHFGVRLTEEDRSALVGINDPSLLEALLKRAETPVTLEQLQAERTRHGNYYENGADLHTQPGLREFLSALRAQGIRTGVVSSTRSHQLHRQRLRPRRHGLSYSHRTLYRLPGRPLCPAVGAAGSPART